MTSALLESDTESLAIEQEDIEIPCDNTSCSAPAVWYLLCPFCARTYLLCTAHRVKVDNWHGRIQCDYRDGGCGRILSRPLPWVRL